MLNIFHMAQKADKAMNMMKRVMQVVKKDPNGTTRDKII